MNILVINLGATSTKVAYHSGGAPVVESNIRLDSLRLRDFPTVAAQYGYRYDTLIGFLNENNIDPKNLDAIVTRGGHTEPVTGGVYRITEKMLEQSASQKYGFNPADLGLRIAYEMGAEFGGEAFTVDPPATCEFETYAFYSGMPEIRRVSAFHALNQRAVGKQYARDHGKRYEDICLVVAHMGGGVSVAAHKYGRLTDANNAIVGDGPFSTDRTGGLPVGQLIDMCYSGRYNHREMYDKINGVGGLMGYLGESDIQDITGRALEGDKRCAEVLGAMCYQIAKEIGAYAAVLKGEAEAIILTGDMAFSDYLTDEITRYVSFLAPVARYPGEFEMAALADGAKSALEGAVEIRTL